MEQYLINDTTLTAIGDALRNKTGGEIKIEIVEHTVPYIISKTPNAKNFTEHNGGYGNSMNMYDFAYIPGATKIKVKMAYQTEGTNWDYVQVAAGKITSMPSTITKYGDKTLSQVELEFDNTDTITFYFKTDGSSDNYLGYYAECTGYDADGNVIYCTIQEEKEVPNIFLPTEMPAAINNMDIVPPEGYSVSGNCKYKFNGNGWNWYIETFGDKIITKNITNMEYMFSDCTNLTTIPFDINVSQGNATNATNMFNACQKLTTLPRIINMTPNNIDSIFSYCQHLREIPDDYFDTWDWGYMDNQTGTYACSRGGPFSYCFSLRKFPMEFLAHDNPVSYSGYVIYYNLFNYCYVLDEVLNLPIPYTATYTGNLFNNTFNNCYRLKNMTFETNEDGTPKVMNWKSQTIDLSSVGYLASTSYQNYITSYNSGITSDKLVIDDATYAALKDDPDWFTAYISGGALYCRYNHDSAVATINSLPDTSAYLASAGGTNTIKFKGFCGGKTDGGAISDLTAEEIAVAAAKGWTVSLV